MMIYLRLIIKMPLFKRKCCVIEALINMSIFSLINKVSKMIMIYLGAKVLILRKNLSQAFKLIFLVKPNANLKELIRD